MHRNMLLVHEKMLIRRIIYTPNSSNKIFSLKENILLLEVFFDEEKCS